MCHKGLLLQRVSKGELAPGSSWGTLQVVGWSVGRSVGWLGTHWHFTYNVLMVGPAGCHAPAQEYIGFQYEVRRQPATPSVTKSNSPWSPEMLPRSSRFERLELGYPSCFSFSVVYFSRGTLPSKKGKRALLEDLATIGLPLFSDVCCTMQLWYLRTQCSKHAARQTLQKVRVLRWILQAHRRCLNQASSRAAHSVLDVRFNGRWTSLNPKLTACSMSMFKEKRQALTCAEPPACRRFVSKQHSWQCLKTRTTPNNWLHVCASCFHCAGKMGPQVRRTLTTCPIAMPKFVPAGLRVLPQETRSCMFLLQAPSHPAKSRVVNSPFLSRHSKGASTLQRLRCKGSVEHLALDQKGGQQGSLRAWQLKPKGMANHQVTSHKQSLWRPGDGSKSRCVFRRLELETDHGI